MLSDFTGAEKVYIACGYTDVRKGIDGLAAMVQQEFELDPYNGPINLDHGIEKMREHGIMRLNEGRSKHHVIQNLHVGVQGEGSH